MAKPFLPLSIKNRISAVKEEGFFFFNRLSLFHRETLKGGWEAAGVCRNEAKAVS